MNNWITSKFIGNEARVGHDDQKCKRWIIYSKLAICY